MYGCFIVTKNSFLTIFVLFEPLVFCLVCCRSGMKLWQDWQAAAVIDDNFEVLEVEIYKGSLNKEIVAKRLRLLSSGVLLQEAKHLLQRYPEAELVQPSDNIHEKVELPIPDEERMKILDEAALLLSKQDVDESASDPDRRLEHLIRAAEEIRSSWVLLEARLTEWIVLLLPRARMESDRNRIAKLVMESNKLSDLAEHFDVDLPPSSPKETEWSVIKHWSETVASLESQLARIESTVRISFRTSSITFSDCRTYDCCKTLCCCSW